MTDAGARQTATIAADERIDQGPTVRQMLSLWVPLAASIVMMVLEPSIINIGLGRTADPELALAAFGVAYGLALLVEAPILMLLDASVARSTDRAAFVLIRRFTLGLGLIVTATGLIVSLTPLYGFLVEEVMNIPPDVAARARPTLQILSLWPLPIGWRRAHQGLLIRTRRTAVISVATVVRLLTLAGTLFSGLVLLPDRGALLAGIAMVISAFFEAALNTWATRPILRSDAFQAEAPGDGPTPLSLRELWRFYRPLAVTTILRQTTRPLLNTGIAAAAMVRASLATWPVAWGLATLITGPAWSLQQLTTTLVTGQRAYRKVRRFVLTLSTLLSLLLCLVVFTPAYGWVMGSVYNLSPNLQDLARPAMQLMVIFPLMMGAQALLRGVLIRGGSTGAVRTAMAINVSMTGATLLVGIAAMSLTGVVLAAAATLIGGLAELAWLRRRAWG